MAMMRDQDAILSLFEMSIDKRIPLTKESFDKHVKAQGKSIQALSASALWFADCPYQLVRVTQSMIRNREVVGMSMAGLMSNAIGWFKGDTTHHSERRFAMVKRNIILDELVMEGLNAMESCQYRDAPLFHNLNHLRLCDGALDMNNDTPRHCDIASLAKVLRFYCHWFKKSRDVTFVEICEIVTLRLLSRHECILAANCLIEPFFQLENCDVSSAILLMYALSGVSVAYWYLDPDLFLKWKDYTMARRKLVEYNGRLPSPFQKLKNRLFGDLRSCCQFPDGVAGIIGSCLGL